MDFEYKFKGMSLDTGYGLVYNKEEDVTEYKFGGFEKKYTAC